MMNKEVYLKNVAESLALLSRGSVYLECGKSL